MTTKKLYTVIRSIRINGGSGLFHFTVLCSYANFRTSYRRIDGISYTVSPGEWVCTVKELSCWFRTRFHRQALSMLDTLQKQHLISYTLLGRGNVVKYKILHWARHNSALEYVLTIAGNTLLTGSCTLHSR